MSESINSSISLVSHIHSLSQDFLRIKLSESGLSDFVSSHGNILFQLSNNGSMTMSDLTKKINRDKSTTTVLVRKLEKDGFIESACVNNDKRIKTLTLTEKGKQLKEKIDEISHQLIETFYKDFSEEEKELFFTSLKKIATNFESEI